MNSAGLSVIDWAILLLYAGATIWLGWHFGKKQKSAAEFFTGSGKMNPLLIGVSLFASLLSTITYLSLPGEVTGKGPAFLIRYLSYPLVFLVVALVLLPVYMRQRVTSAYELLEENLGVSVRLLGASMFLLLRLVWMSLLIFAAAKAFSYIIGVDTKFVPLIVLAAGTISLIYASLGGLRAVVITDLMQTLLLYGGALLVIVVVTTEMGGFGWFPTKWQDHWDTQPVFSVDPRVRVTWFGTILSMFVWSVATFGGDQVSVAAIHGHGGPESGPKSHRAELNHRRCRRCHTRFGRVRHAQLFPGESAAFARRFFAERQRRRRVPALHRLSPAGGGLGSGGGRLVCRGHVEHGLGRQLDHRGGVARFRRSLPPRTDERGPAHSLRTLAHRYRRCDCFVRQRRGPARPWQHRGDYQQDGQSPRCADFLSVSLCLVFQKRHSGGCLGRLALWDDGGGGDRFLGTYRHPAGREIRSRSGNLRRGIDHRDRTQNRSASDPGSRSGELPMDHTGGADGERFGGTISQRNNEKTTRKLLLTLGCVRKPGWTWI